MNKQKIANDYAKAHGADKAVYLKKYNGYACFEPVSDAGPCNTGLPLVIMVDSSGNARMSTPEEATKI